MFPDSASAARIFPRRRYIISNYVNLTTSPYCGMITSAARQSAYSFAAVAVAVENTTALITTAAGLFPRKLEQASGFFVYRHRREVMWGAIPEAEIDGGAVLPPTRVPALIRSRR